MFKRLWRWWCTNREYANGRKAVQCFVRFDYATGLYYLHRANAWAKRGQRCRM